MRLSAIEQLCCPECRAPLELKPGADVQNGAVIAGTLACGECARDYEIASGIPILLPGHLPNPGELELRGRVSEEADPDHWQSEYDHHHFRALFQLRLERLLHEDARVLDIGVGWGVAYLPFASRVELWGIDFSFESLVLMRELYRRARAPMPVLICASLNAIPIRDVRFDLVQSVQVYQHIEDRADVESSWSFVADELLAPGGVLVVENLNWHRVEALARLSRLLRRGAERPLKEGRTEAYFLRHDTARELKASARRAAPDARISTSYSETLFHPNLRLTPRSRLVARLDSAISRTPLSRVLGRQARLTVQTPA